MHVPKNISENPNTLNNLKGKVYIVLFSLVKKYFISFFGRVHKLVTNIDTDDTKTAAGLKL